MTTPIDWDRARHQREVMRRMGQFLGDTAKDIEEASSSFDELVTGIRNRDEYIQHLERRMAELRDPPRRPESVLGVLAALQDAGVTVQEIRVAASGDVVQVRLLWPGDEHPSEHRRINPDHGDAEFAAEIREYAASISAANGPAPS